MKRLLFISIFFLYYFDVSSQVVIGPEMGIYYRPYGFRVVSNYVKQNKVEYYAGIIGEVKLMTGLFAQTRISYIFRNGAESGLVRTFNPDLKDVILSNKEMTLNVDVLYEPVKNSKIGLGLGMIHKLNSQVQENFYNTNSIIKYFSPGAYYNISVVLNQNWGRIGLSARYFYLFKSENIDSLNARIMDDKSGFSLGFNYMLFGYK